VSQRRAAGPGQSDLLSILLGAYEDGEYDMPYKLLRDEIATMLVAGHESSADALGWAFYLLSKNPDVETRLLSEIRTVLNGRLPDATDLTNLPYTNAVVKEALRLYPPGWAFGRLAVEDCRVGGYDVPKGAFLFASPWVVQRDPRWYEQPLAFKPERWASEEMARLPKFAFFPFGGGQRMCIGHAFATTELALVLATVLPRFRIACLPGHRVEPFPSNTLRPRYGIQAVLQRR
jgi:cytochrome P450